MLNIRTLALSCIAALSLLALPKAASAQVVPGEEHCVINVSTWDVLNIRARGSVNSPVWGTLRYAECGVHVVGACRGSWCPIEDGHHSGWVHSHFISMVSPARYCVAGVAYNDVLNLRAYPSANSRILTKLPPDRCGIAFLPYSVGNWQKVRAGGYEGWVNRRYLSGQ